MAMNTPVYSTASS